MSGAKIIGLVCPECKEERCTESGVPGLSKCLACGYVWPTPSEIKPPAPIEGDDHTFEDALDLVIPDTTELAIGWRAWAVPDHWDEYPQLQSVAHAGSKWEPREPMEATCAISTGRANGVQREGHEVPDESCRCGLYSAKTLEHLLHMRYHRYDIDRGLYTAIGKVKLWGKVIEGTQGWRAQFGYPEHLYVPFEAYKTLEPLTEAYGVPVELKNILKP